MGSSLEQRSRDRLGTTLNGKWHLDHVLGVGGMGAVYAATHRNQRKAAIKMLHRELSINDDIRERFLREGYLANTVGHPAAVSVLDDDIAEDGSVFLVMELVQGDTLDTKAQQLGGRMSVAEVLPLMHHLLDLLAAAHAKGIVHRDLKPENLVLTPGGRLKVLDFGIASVREQQRGASTTQTGVVLGSPAYMSPEQAAGRREEIDAQSDLWAVGATMFNLLSGEIVHPCGTLNEIMAAAIYRPARSLAEVLPDLPPAVVDLVDRSLAHDKADRFESASQMQHQLEQLLADLGIPLPRPWSLYPPPEGEPRLAPRTRRGPSGAPVGPHAATLADPSTDDGRWAAADAVSVDSLPGEAGPHAAAHGAVSVAGFTSQAQTRPERGRKWPWILAVALFAGAVAALVTVVGSTPDAASPAHGGEPEETVDASDVEPVPSNDALRDAPPIDDVEAPAPTATSEPDPPLDADAEETTAPEVPTAPTTTVNSPGPSTPPTPPPTGQPTAAPDADFDPLFDRRR